MFTCPACDAPVYFRNLTCGCGAALAFEPEAGRFVPADDPCGNRPRIGCNWRAEGGGLCRSCAMTEVVPDDSWLENQGLWSDTELAKRWVLATVGRWGWFKNSDPGRRPVFHLLSEATWSGWAPVSMGHASGLVTLNVSEADAATRAVRREDLNESFRTMIGHVRHELGHFFLDRLIGIPAFAEPFRALFGDERADYGAAIDSHQWTGPPAGWEGNHVTAYAASHPHEDWAETLAHLLHLTDITDSASAARLAAPSLTPGYDPYAETDTETLLTTAVDLGMALNHVTRSMGLADVYPFVLSGRVREKMAFVHRWMRG